MPIYEYRCTNCGKLTDIHHGFDERATQACEHCNGELARNFSAAGIVFKGSGFYKTDSRTQASDGSSGSTSSSSPGISTSSSSTSTGSPTGTGSGASGSSGDAGGKSESGSGSNAPAPSSPPASSGDSSSKAS